MIFLTYILNLGILLGLVWWLRQQAWASALGRYFYPALLLRGCCGILLGLLYFNYYGSGDTITYHRASVLLTELAFKDAGAYFRLLVFNDFGSEAFRVTIPFSRFPGFTNSFYFVKLLSLLNLVTAGSYYLNSFYLSAFSFWGAAKLTAVLARQAPTYRTAALIAFLFFPSVVFWSSGVLKDALLFGSMCWLVAFALQVANNWQQLAWDDFVLFPLMLFLFFRIKFFLAFIVLPLLLLYVVVTWLGHYQGTTQRRATAGMAGGTIVLGLVGLWFFSVYHDGFLYKDLVHSYESLLAKSLQKPHIYFAMLQPTAASVAYNAPKAIYSAILRPFVWESHYWLYLLMGIENVMIGLLLMMVLLALAKGKASPPRPEHVLFLAIVVALAIIFGLSTPNFGTLSRYRIAFLPFLIYMLLQNRYVQALQRKKWPKQ